MKYLIAILMVVTLAACSSTPKKDELVAQTVRPANEPTPPAVVQSMASVPPGQVLINMPVWYMKRPPMTEDALFVSGSATSRDMPMAIHKAILNAQIHIGDQLSAELNTITKDYSKDSGGQFRQTTEILAVKLATDVKLIGYEVMESVAMSEGNGYRVYVLLKYPLGTNNHLLQQYLADLTAKADKENLEQTMANQKVMKSRATAAMQPTKVKPITDEPVPIETSRVETLPLTPTIVPNSVDHD